MTTAANVLIHEEGRLQLCDFGVATVFDSKGDKRKTFIGTVHWMPPEMWSRELEYSGEVAFSPLLAVVLQVPMMRLMGQPFQIN